MTKTSSPKRIAFAALFATALVAGSEVAGGQPLEAPHEPIVCEYFEDGSALCSDGSIIHNTWIDERALRAEWSIDTASDHP